MRLRLAISFGLLWLVTTACFIQEQQPAQTAPPVYEQGYAQPQGAYAQPGYAQPQGDPYAQGAAAPPAEPAPSGPAHYSISIHSDCDRTLGLYQGDGTPPYGSGTYGSIGSNTTTSYSGFAPENFCVMDEQRNALGCYTASGGSVRVEIPSTCSGFIQR
jgi:hypothetical protein